MLEPLNITPLCDDPERAHAVGAVYWEARPLRSSDGGLIKCIVGEDWIVQRIRRASLRSRYTSIPIIALCPTPRQLT